MELSRLNPVTLITGAATGVGAAVVHDIAPRSSGGLILIDNDEGLLSVTADSISRPPERVSSLTFDVADGERWAKAVAFIKSQYGRIDWAVIDAGGAMPGALLDVSKKDTRRAMSARFDAAIMSLRFVMPLIAANTAGGAIVLYPSAATLNADANANGALKVGLMQVLRAAAKEAAPNSIRINAILPDDADVPVWKNAPLLQTLANEHGGYAAGLLQVGKLSPPLARYAAADGLGRLAAILLSDACPVTGAALVLDGSDTL